LLSVQVSGMRHVRVVGAPARTTVAQQEDPTFAWPTHTLRRRVSAAATVLTLSVALPLGIGVTPAYAVEDLDMIKSHTGNFARGGDGTYLITIENDDDTPTGPTSFTDTLPQGLTVTNFGTTGPTEVGVQCSSTSTTVSCTSEPLPSGAVYTVQIGVAVAEEAPCSVTNTATVVDQNDANETASADDPTPITGGACSPGGGDGGNGSLLPVNLSGILPTYNSTTDNTFNSQGTTNITGQDAHPNP
jgi:uncharacterized repeat protein (TIGR01451 family)